MRETSISSIPVKIPPSWILRSSELVGVLDVEAAGHRTRIEITSDHLARLYLPVLALLQSNLDLLEARARSGAMAPRLIAGLVGVPGGGKSVFCAGLSMVADRVLSPGRLTVIGMDGWHYPNAVLDQRWTTDAAGKPIPLRQRKGGPESYDVGALVAALRALRSAGGTLRVPVYDRRLHDPVPDGLCIPAGSQLLLIEGNYLLVDAPPWDELGSLLDVKFYLECDAGVAQERIIARHMRGGLSACDAHRKYALNDAINTAVVQSTISTADHVLRF